MIGAGHSNCCYEERLAQDKADFREALKNSLAEQFWQLRELYNVTITLWVVLKWNFALYWIRIFTVFEPELLIENHDFVIDV